MSRFDENVAMPIDIDDYFYQLLIPLCGQLTGACVDAAWQAIVQTLLVHVEREAAGATREAVTGA